MPTDNDGADPDHQFATWMRANLAYAAEQFNMHVTGEPVFGWRLRSIGAPAQSRTGSRWLRVVSERPEWACGEFWTGNADANALPPRFPKPYLLATFEWDEWRRQRAEVLTLLPGRPCSPVNAPRANIHLPPTWWAALRRALSTLSAVSTPRVNAAQDRITDRIHAAFGDHVDTEVHEWETVHGDLHWNNLLHPEFGLLDWEGWGRGPLGLDAATLYCYSLLAPATAKAVHALFHDVLNSPSGRIAQLYAAARLQHRIALGDHPALEEPLNTLAETLLTSSTRRHSDSGS